MTTYVLVLKGYFYRKPKRGKNDELVLGESNEIETKFL